MSTNELSHEHAERTTRLLYCLTRDDKFDIVSASEKINNGFEATAKRFYPVDPKRIGAQAFCIKALRWTSREYLTGVLTPRAGPSPFRYPYTDYIPRAVGLHLEPSPIAEGKRWFEGMNPTVTLQSSTSPRTTARHTTMSTTRGSSPWRGGGTGPA